MGYVRGKKEEEKRTHAEAEQTCLKKLASLYIEKSYKRMNFHRIATEWKCLKLAEILYPLHRWNLFIALGVLWLYTPLSVFTFSVGLATAVFSTSFVYASVENNQ